jgi:hypothetical protein
MVCLWGSGQGSEDRLRHWGLWDSIDMFLPIIELDKDHNNITLQGCTKVYFYFYKICGYVLALFLVAALAGLTK